MIKSIYILFIAASLFSCKRDFEAVIPDNNWDQFTQPSAKALPPWSKKGLEGIYQFTRGTDVFGVNTAAKWSYTADGTDTVYHLSFFCETGVTYFICEGRKVDSTILLSGYWRRMINDLTGSVRLTVTAANGAGRLLFPQGSPPDSLIITGVYSNGSDPVTTPLELRWVKPLKELPAFEVVAHRGGGRTSDLLPASENSVEMIKLASEFGATGIEIDVRLTSDGVPILFHDATLNERVIEKNGMVGPIENYTFAQLESLVKLKRGGRIPTLRQALSTVVYSTPLRYVWLDTKFNGNMQIVRDLQQEFMGIAASLNKPLLITIGIPDMDVYNNFKKLNNYQNIPSVCELGTEYVTELNSRIWGPTWTLGLQNDAVAAMRAQGRGVYTWTMDIPFNIRQYMTEGQFNGILSNFPSIVAYYAYARP